MQAMPQSFRALADRVGEVADLLSHAQADLPNWWKGPAAKQAAASLGRAAAEAREFHDSAMGAATAVSRCAQVVAEQQYQMMNVPDVPEPGISDVVQRPTTPFEALEAARQDAAYQAAHEQAVQVVNGIAAQYVETRAILSSMSPFEEAKTSMPSTRQPGQHVPRTHMSALAKEHQHPDLNAQSATKYAATQLERGHQYSRNRTICSDRTIARKACIRPTVKRRLSTSIEKTPEPKRHRPSAHKSVTSTTDPPRSTSTRSNARHRRLSRMIRQSSQRSHISSRVHRTCIEPRHCIHGVRPHRMEIT